MTHRSALEVDVHSALVHSLSRPSRASAASCRGWRWRGRRSRSRFRSSSYLDHRLDGEVEGGRDETCPFSLLGERSGLCFVARLSLEFESERQSREAEASVGTLAGDAVAVDAQARVGEPGAGGETGEGDSQARGCRGDEEIFGTPGGGIAAMENRW